MQISDDWPALAEAIRLGDVEGARSALEEGVDFGHRFLDARRKGRGWLPLEYATYRNAGPMVALLLGHGADESAEFNARGQTWTCEDFAEAHGLQSALEALRGGGADAKEEEEQPEEEGSRASDGPRALPRSSVLKRGSGTTKKRRDAVVKFQDLEMGEEIGKGAYGRVMRATYQGRMQVACKFVTEPDSKREQENLRREIKLHHSQRHAHIVKMIGLSRCADSRQLVIVMEFIEGGDLLTLLKKNDVELAWPVRVRMAKQVSSALAYMHSHHQLHRDLKSENILVDNDLNVQLADFGFARSLDVDGAGGARSRASTVCGTPYYSAPEQILGRPYDGKADVFALGILMLELITRRAVNVDRIPQRDLERPCGIDSVGLVKKCSKISYPQPFMKLALVCTEYKPEKRPMMSQVEQMCQAIQSSLEK